LKLEPILIDNEPENNYIRDTQLVVRDQYIFLIRK